MIAKKNFVVGSVVSALTLAGAHAATVTTNPTPYSIVQTSSFSIVPTDFINSEFALFNTAGGARTLTAVHIEVQYTKTGGQLSIDNDSGSGATVNLTHRVTASLSEQNTLDFTKVGGSALGFVGSTNKLRATSVVNGVNVAATDGDSTSEYNPDGLDNFTFFPSDITVSDAGEMSDISQFIGNGNFDMSFEAEQVINSSVNSGMYLAFGPSTVNGFVKVTYEFTGQAIPEPSVITLMGACGAFALLRRRR